MLLINLLFSFNIFLFFKAGSCQVAGVGYGILSELEDHTTMDGCFSFTIKC